VTQHIIKQAPRTDGHVDPHGGKLLDRLTMKKIKSPWYEIIWMSVWSAALAAILGTGMFDTKETAGLILVWAVLMGLSIYSLALHFKARRKKIMAQTLARPETPGLNAPCPCGSGKKYKRCCGAKNR
jgi:hypothetical protein